MSSPAAHHHVAADSLTTTRDRHRLYVRAVREELTRCTALEAHDAAEQQRVQSGLLLNNHEIITDEVIARALLQREEAVDVAVSVLRAAIFGEEASGFGDVVTARRSEALVPWCTNGCRYCCMSRLNWTAHVTTVYRSVWGAAWSTEARNREEIEASEATARSTLSQRWDLVVFQSRLKSEERALFSHREALAREQAIKACHSARETEIDKPWAAILSGVRMAADTQALREKSAATLRLQDTLGLEARRMVRQYVALATEDERATRAQLVATEEVRRGQLLVRIGDVTLNEKLSKMRDELDAVVQERDELLNARDVAMAEATEAAAQKVRDEQRALETEFAELKRMKKQGGADKSAPAAFNCPKCGLPPIKDFLTHRLAECTERPVQCPKCDRIMKAAALDLHRTSTCPCRVVECPRCHNHYKAVYLEQRHSTGGCLSVAHARTCLTGLKPTGLMGVDFEMRMETSTLDTPPGAGALFAFIQPVDSATHGAPKLPAGVSASTWRAVESVDGQPVLSVRDVDDIVARLDIGQQIMVKLKQADVPALDATGSKKARKSAAPAPVVVSDEADPNTVVATVGTSLPLSEYSGLVAIVREDEAQYCAPQPTKGAKGGKAKSSSP